MATTEKPVVATGTNGTNTVPHHQQNSYLHHPDYAALGEGVMAPPFGGALQPGLWRPYEHRKFANPAPLGLSAFALTTFVLSCVNMHARDVTIPNIAVPLAFGYGGLVQLLAGMWEMAVGNTFGATALSSYGGFWIAYGLLLTPNWGITNTDTGPYKGNASQVSSAVGFFLTGWWIFTTLLLLCTLKSTLAFFLLFFTLDIAFLCLSCEKLRRQSRRHDRQEQPPDGRWPVWHAGSVPGLVQCPRRYPG
jgi:succinate-acetate transporter protein